ERENVFDEPEPPAIALSHGSTVTGAVQWEGGGSRAAIGLPLHQLEGILREATPGDLYLTRPITEVLLEDIQKAGVRPTAQKSLMSTQQLYAIKIEDAAAVAGVEFRSASETQTIFQRDQRALADVAPGSLLGNRFEVLASLGIGRMGVVLKVRDRDRDVLSALKLLKPEMMDQQQVERLAGQVRLLRAVQHPNVVGVLDFGQVDGLPYLLLDYVRGLTLRTLLAAGRAVPPLAALRIAKDMVSGLGAMHTERLLHRDLRPENIFLDPAGNVKLADAGIAPPLDSAAGVQLTSPSYLAPEQLEGRTLDPRADFFSAGVVMYEMFTGQVPVAGGTLTEIRTRRRETLIEPPSQHNADLPEALDQLVMRCLDPDPDKRFEDADALRTALDALAG
ncbi:MAG: serine/threonine-protein kinase, partial [Acidobacteriota bacterium]